MNDALFSYLLRLGDTSLILGHRLAEWSSNAPYLEEDLALSNMALDHIGRAQALLQYAGQVEGKSRSEDDLAYLRPEREFVNLLIVEQPNGDFAKTIVRQLLYTAFDLPLYRSLVSSKDAVLSGIAAKAVKESTYHLRHASDWMYRLGDGTEESHQRTQRGLEDLWMFTGEMFETDEVIDAVVREGIGVDPSALRNEWNATVSGVIETSTLTKPADGYMQTGSRNGVHSEYLGFILAEMQFLPRAYPDAKW
jgi:ring-1,2-phenylacetyl-CoA epoxidase subunit PaaC